jgi:hypothetical protein
MERRNTVRKGDMGIRGDEGDACRVVDISAISTIPPHLPISFS